MARRAPPNHHYVACDCCRLEFAARDAMAWHEKKPARRLKVLDTASEPDDGTGPYRDYWVEHEHRVCPDCYAYLEGGGQFQSLRRNRGKLAVLTVIAILAVLILTLPVWLPRVMSALWIRVQ